MKQYITNSANETKDLAQNLAKNFKGVLALQGNLGTGKTTFTQGFAKGLRIKDKIISPTFVLIREHKIPKTDKILFHIDLYRLEDSSQLKPLGLDDLFKNPSAITLIEWPEKAKEILPKNTTYLKIDVVSENKRKITVT